MKQSTMPEVLLSGLIEDTLTLMKDGRKKGCDRGALQKFLIYDVNKAIEEIALPGLGPSVRNWVYSTVALYKPLRSKDVNHVIDDILSSCPVWKNAAISDTSTLKPGDRVALLSADLDAISLATIKRKTVKEHFDRWTMHYIEVLAADDYQLDPWGHSIGEIWFDESTATNVIDARPPVRVAKRTLEIMDLINNVRNLRDCQHKIRTMEPKSVSETYLLHREVDRLNNILKKFEELGMANAVTWK